MNRARGRPPGRSGAAGTSAAILAAARSRFLSQGYRGTTLRAVAADACVDSALISYYFGSKQGLFGACMSLSLTPSVMLARALDGDPATMPQRLLAGIMAAWDHPQSGDPLAALITGALHDPEIMRLLEEWAERELIGRIAEYLGGRRATERATAIITVVTGLIFSRYLLRLGSATAMSASQVIGQLSPMIGLAAQKTV